MGGEERCTLQSDKSAGMAHIIDSHKTHFIYPFSSLNPKFWPSVHCSVCPPGVSLCSGGAGEADNDIVLSSQHWTITRHPRTDGYTEAQVQSVIFSILYLILGSLVIQFKAKHFIQI